MHYITIIGMFLVLLLPKGCHPQREEQKRIIGVKIYDHQGSILELFDHWNNLGINTAFTSLELLSNDEFRSEALVHKISTFAIFPVFFDPEVLADSPGLYAITALGQEAREEWVEFVCPSRQEYRQKVVEQAKEIIRKYDPDGLSIDFIRHFVFWEKVYPERDAGTLPHTCFDPVCLELFQEEARVSIPDSLISVMEKASWILENNAESWTEWRCNQITSMVQEIAAAVRELKPGIMINVHLVPWREKEFDGAIKTVAGQDVAALSQVADWLSPMTYAHMLKREPPWIHEVVEDMYRQTTGPILPSIQVNSAYLGNEYGVEEFKYALEEALRSPSLGVVFWSWEQLVQYPEKMEVLKDIVNAD